MSFIGAIAPPIRQALALYAAEVKGPALLCGAGNFTIASVLRSGGFRGAISACDITLYSSALGAYLSDTRLDVNENPECPAHLSGWLDNANPLNLAASVALLFDLNQVWQAKNPYQQKALRSIRANWPQLMQATREKLKAYKKHISPISYQPLDGFELLASADKNATVFIAPPTYKRGYERLEKLFAAVARWQPPKYREMTDQDLSLFEQIAFFDNYFVILEKDLPEVYEILGPPRVAAMRGRGKPTYILTRQKDLKPLVMRKPIKTAPFGPILPSGQTIQGTEQAAIAPITLAQSLRFNELFLSRRIDYFTGGVGLSLAFTLDGQAIGKADFAKTTHQWKLPGNMVYLMSDLAVPSAEPRLAKLVLMCLLSVDARELLKERFLDDFKYVVTSAFSPHPVSMKYRGLFKLHKRIQGENGYTLNYYARLGRWSLAQALALWRKKYAK